MGLPSAKKHRVIWVASLCFASLAVVFFIFFPGRSDSRDSYLPIFSPFLGQADSLIRQLTPEEKVYSIFLCGYPSLYSDTASVSNGLLPFVYTTPGHFLNGLKEDSIDVFPDKNQLLSLHHSELLSRAMTMIGDHAVNRGIHIWSAPDIHWLKSHPQLYNLPCQQLLITAVTVNAGDLPALGRVPSSSLPLILVIDNDSILTDRKGNNRYFSQVLREDMGYQGVIAAPFPGDNPEAHLKRDHIDLFYAGSRSLSSIRREVKEMINGQAVSASHLDKRLRRIVSMALWQQQGRDSLCHKPPILKEDSIQNIYYQHFIMDRVKRKSSVLLSNPDNLLPLHIPSDELNLYLPDPSFWPFAQQLSMYTPVAKHISSPGGSSVPAKGNAIVVLCGLSMDSIQLSSTLDSLDVLGSTAGFLAVVLFDGEARADSIYGHMSVLQVWQSSIDDQRYAAQAIVGGQHISGRHPPPVPRGYRYEQTTKNRLGYAHPHVMMLDTSILNKIDSLVSDAINAYAFPGCQVYFSYGGDVVFQKSYGHHTYSRQLAVEDHHVYDLASITKVAATTLKAMHLAGKNKLDPRSRLGKFFKDTLIEYTRIPPDTLIIIDTLFISKDTIARFGYFARRDSERPPPDTILADDSLIVLTDTIISRITPRRNIFKCTVEDLLIHKSGLPPSLPILPYLLYARDTVLPLPASFIIDADSLLTFDSLASRSDSLQYLFYKYFNRRSLKDTSDRLIAKGMYLRNLFADTLWMDMKQTRVYSREVYMYSDLNPVLLQMAMDSLSGKPINRYLQRYFYGPLGLENMVFNPLLHFRKNRIVPTEKDIFWRQQLLHGYVHDPSAALMGGVAGNAGLFSNAADLGILFQMFLQQGSYGGRRYLEPSVIRLFTQRHKRSHRAMGFDLVSQRSISASSASPQTYGHTGFTGTCVWADPQIELVYVFLSNRVYPKASNHKINSMRVRQNIHQTFYDAIIPLPE